MCGQNEQGKPKLKIKFQGVKRPAGLRGNIRGGEKMRQKEKDREKTGPFLVRKQRAKR